MMVSFTYLNSPIEFEEDKIPVLVIENKKLFRDVLFSFLAEMQEEYFTFSKDYKPFEFNKLGYFISNPINLDFKNKKLMTKINSFLSLTVNNEFAEELVNVNQSIFTLADKLVSMSSFDLTYDETSVDAAALIKLLSFQINTNEQSLCELLISVILFMSKYLKTEVFVISNLYVYFSIEEISEIYKTLLLNHINLLIIEQNIPPHSQNYESVYIIDNDLCQIDKEVIK